MVGGGSAASGAVPWKALWGKWGRQRDATPDSPVHPLICHLLDVAAVAATLWDTAFLPGARGVIAADLDLDEGEARAWLAFIAGSHDLGKASPAFAVQVAPLKEHLQQAGYAFHELYRGERQVGHGVITAKALPELLESVGVSRRAAARLSTVAGGHHGIFPTGQDLGELTGMSSGDASWQRARSALFEVLQEQVLPARLSAPGNPAASLCLFLAGFITVADWIGSNTDFFPYAARLGSLGQDPPDLAEYYQRSLEAARRAMRSLGWVVPEPPPAVPFQELFGFSPRPLQELAADVAEQLPGPGIVVVEAPLGEGKTEAALFLADAWSRAAGTRGSYVGLPTQATSNQMFARVEQFLERRYAGSQVELQLLHGQAVLSAAFQELRKQSGELFTVSGVCDEQTSQASVAASEWFTHAKRGLLAAFGVGTVDQALLAALKLKHGFVRIFGLTCRTFVADEVHAYETYMSTLLQRLVEWLGAVHAPVVLLSATLPRARTEELLACYARGAGWPETPPRLAAYPRVTWLGQQGGSSRSFAPATPERRVRLERIPGFQSDSENPDDYVELGQRLRDVLAGGGCAAVICNTVRRAQTVYQALRSFFADNGSDGAPELDLLHARFLFRDRDARERRTLQRFGKPSDPSVHRPHRAVLVATQVVEQSLDLDFDLLVTEMAPADLILQRSGRLHRHERPARPDGVAAPTVWLLEPEVREGVPRFRAGTEAVYEPHVLLRSWLALQDRAFLEIPGAIEEIVEAVYDSRPAPVEPAALAERWRVTEEQARENRDGARFQAEVRQVQGPHHGGAISEFTERVREEDAPEIHPALQAVTRLGPPSVRVVLLGPGDPPPGDRPPNLEATRELLSRSLDIAHRAVVHQLLQKDPPTVWQGSALLRHCRLIELDQGQAPIDTWTLRLDPELGLLILKRTGGES